MLTLNNWRRQKEEKNPPSLTKKKRQNKSFESWKTLIFCDKLIFLLRWFIILSET